MNRIIKFRAWHLGKMYYPDELKPKFYMNLDGEIVRSYDDQVLSNQFELMQFTGLTDKNGKEIFEGDIVKGIMYPDCSQIIFDGRFATFKAQSGTQLIRLGYECEVIGNIYENPE